MAGDSGRSRRDSSGGWTGAKAVINDATHPSYLPGVHEAFEADPQALEYRCPRCRAVFYPGEDPLGTDLEDEIRSAMTARG